jgi:ATP-dependent DNA helicase PIF1
MDLEQLTFDYTAPAPEGALPEFAGAYLPEPSDPDWKDQDDEPSAEQRKVVTQEDIDKAWTAYNQSPIEAKALLGRAGSGKSTMVKALLEKWKLLLTATTGVAAYNLGDNCTTINSLMGFYDAASLRERMESTWWLSKKFEQLRQYDGVVIDEVSMMKADVLDLLISAFIKISEWRAAEGLMPLKILLVGDFLQLPPVEKGIEPRFAFHSGWWSKFFTGPNQIKLTTIYRQQDPAFQQALQFARQGDGVNCMMLLRSRGLQMVAQPWYGFPGFSLYPTNQSVDVHNRTRLGELDSPGFTVSSSRWGEMSEELKEIPDTIGFKIGCRVRFTANNGSTYVNGMLGTLMDYTPERGFIITSDDNRVIVPQIHYRMNARPTYADDQPVIQKTQHMDYKTFMDYRDTFLLPQQKLPFYDPTNDKIVIGVVEYLPVVLGYASTYHKSQGLTFDRVQIDIRNRFAGNAQMIYVALSRCRTVEGLLVVGTWDQLARRIYTSPAVKEFI